MAGNANSGRKNIEHEKMVRKVLSYADRVVLEALEGKGRFKNLEPSTVAEIAARIHIKAMPQKIEGEMEHSHKLMGTVKVNGKKLDIDIG